MGKIENSIRLNDAMSGPLLAMHRALSIVVTQFEVMQKASRNSVDASAIQAARQQLNLAGAEFSRIEEEASSAKMQQDRFNSSIEKGHVAAGGLENKFKRIATWALSAVSAFKIVNLSDKITQTDARLNMTLDDNGTLDVLKTKVFESANRARADFLDTADIVAKLGLRASDAFGSNDETIQFAENLNKQFIIAGASQEEMRSASLQLTQALGSGVLRGEELNAVFEAAPNVIKTIADSLGVGIGKIREMAADGEITASVVKNAMLGATDEINRQFDSMPKTFSQVWASFKNSITMSMQPAFKMISDFANNNKFDDVVKRVSNTVGKVSVVILKIFEGVGNAANFIYDNWSMIAPVIATATILLGGYNMALGICSIALAVSAAAKALETKETMLATMAQYGLNTALLMCPITWIVAGIIAIIGVLYLVVAAINKVTGSTYSATGIIMGVIAETGAFIANIFMAIMEVCIGVVEVIYNSFATVANFVYNVFADPVAAIIHLFADLTDIVLSMLEMMDRAIDKVFGTNLADRVSGWRDNVSTFADDASEKFGNGKYANLLPKLDYDSILNQFDVKLERFGYKDTFDKGYQFGSNIEDKFRDMFNVDFNMDDLSLDIGDISKNTSDMSKKLSDISIDMTALRNLAEREAINKFTTASVKVEMNNSNNISGAYDIDGMANSLISLVEDGLNMAAEGVHT